jgi:hypothetical protein
LTDPAEALLQNGQVLITLNSKNQFTGALIFEGRKVGFSGRFSSEGNWADVVIVAGRSVELDMFLEGGELGNRVSCSVASDTEQVAAFTLLPAAHTGAKDDAFGWTGARLNVLFESEGFSGETFGHGYASAAISKDGVLRFAGRLADNSAWSGTARVVRDEAGDLRLPLAVVINSSKGLLHGEATLDLQADVQAGEAEFYSVGTWTWVRGADSRAKSYNEGFVESLQPLGQRWNYRRGTNLWTGQPAATSIQLMLGIDGGSPGALGLFTTTGPLNNRPVWSPNLPRGFKLTVTSARGEISGKIPAGVSSGSVPTPSASYRGLLLSPGIDRGSDWLIGGGFLFGSAGSDVVELTGQGQ